MDRAVELINEYKTTRYLTEGLCKDLLIEDYVIQGMEDVSPPKWHLAHTTWFFETFVLNKYADYKNPNPMMSYLFNSYYQGVGKPYPRSQRGLLSRPSVQQIYEYRNNIDNQLINLINNCSSNLLMELQPIITLGIHHEQQHQELLLMDIKYNFFLDPTLPAYCNSPDSRLDLGPTRISTEFQSCWTKSQPTDGMTDFDGGLIHIGYDGNDFCFDNELPRHQKFIQPFSISNALVSNQEYLEFITDNGYFSHNLWLADGWDWLQKNQINAPLYWQLQDHQWMYFTLHGLQPLHSTEPVSHISYYEADAFARWKGCRLPTEEEWEHAVCQLQINHPESIIYGDLWEWTSSAYQPYPGYKPLKGSVGEYNGKFMNNQRVLRGGSFATPRNHIRVSYRNFYGSDKRWQFNGIRLAMDN